MQFFIGVVLFWCVVWVVVGPLISPWIEKRLEWFIFGVGVIAVTISWSWSEMLVIEAIMRPMKVCGAILAGSLLFSFSHDNVIRLIQRAADKIGLKLAVGFTVFSVGVLSCGLTIAVAVLILVEILNALRLDRKSEIHVAVLGCFSIGLGGGLTPIAGPVPAITMAKLADAPYPVDTFYLMNLVGPWALPAMLSLGVVAGLLFSSPGVARGKAEEDPLTLWTILLLTGKMYVFIAGLVLLGGGLVPLIDTVLIGARPGLLYWINSISAVIDGATLASVEISPRMSQAQIRYILTGLLIAGGALVTGNAPNLVAAHKLKISNQEWAKIGLPVGGLLMLFYFFSLVVWA
jgi:predicted cation transporter